MYKTSDIYLHKSVFRGFDMKNRRLLISDAVGCAVIYATAIILHFIFQWFGPSALTILFGAVNESVWEHVKIFSAAYVGYALLQLLWVQVEFRQYVVAKCVGLYLLMGGIIAFHYSYILLTGKHIAWVDILGSAMLVILAQVTSYRLTVGSHSLRDYFAPALFLLMLYYLMFFSFTIFPPKAELFRDPASGGFGYLENAVEKPR